MQNNQGQDKGNILIVDDIPENLRLLSELLTTQGYKVRSVTSGAMALKTVQAKPPDVILLDIKMPEMDGYQVCTTLKANDEICDIPVIFISALNEVFDKVKAFQVGGIDYITKPFQAEEVLARVESQLTIQRQKTLLQQEIENRKQTEEILYQSRALLASVLNSSLDGIAAMQSVREVTGEIGDFRCLVVNPVLARMLGKKREELVGKLALKRLLQRIDLTLFDQFVQVVETGEPLEQDFYYESDNRQCWYHFVTVKLGDGFAMTLRDITSRKQIELALQEANQKFEALANLDGLTQVANRRRFDQEFDQEWKRSLREEQPLSLLLCDVDYFKRYNDAYGHQQGDDGLRQVAQAITQSVRRPADLVARYGGEEFVVLLPNTDSTGAIQVAERIQAQIQQLQILHTHSEVKPYLTLSIGVASQVPTVQDAPDHLIAQADKALYAAKQQGRDRNIVYQD